MVTQKQLLKLSKHAQKQVENYKGLKIQKILTPEFVKLLQKPAVPHLTEKKVGEHEVKIEIVPAGKEMTVVSMRNWLMMGYKPQEVRFTEPRPIFKLYKGTSLLMSDSPQEIFLQYDAYQAAKGRVLMGGLGLGMSANLFAEKPEVTEILVVEISKDVMKLCKPKNKKIKVINGDIKDFINSSKEKFDFIYIDIHYSTGCMEYIHTVLPMRKILGKKFPGTPAIFWGEEEMKSQYDPNFNVKNGV